MATTLSERLVHPAVRSAGRDPVHRRDQARQHWMDVLRGLCILLVLGLHATLIVELHDGTPWDPLVRFNDLFAPYRMPALMFLSGLLLDHSLNKKLLAYADGKIRKILYPYLLWTCVFGLVVKSEFEWHNPWLWMGASYLWYIFFLLIAYAIAPLLRPVNSLYVAIACIALACLTPDGTKYGERLLLLLGYFFLGDVVARSAALRAKLHHPVVFMLALPVTIAFSWVSFAYGGITYQPELFLPTIAGIIVLAHLARLLTQTPAGGFLQFVGEHSIVFYAAHYPFMFAIMGGILAWNADAPAPLIAVAAFLSALAFCWALAWSCQRYGAVQGLFVLPIKWRPAFWPVRT